MRIFFMTAMLGATLAAARAQTPERPNILWLTCEDNNITWVGCYGNPHADTPNIDQLAKDGFQYMHAYANAPVCAPSRSTWITGIHAISMGTHPMRSGYEIPGFIRFYPEYLANRGYYTGNSTKKDYNIGGRKEYSSTVWSNDKKVQWDDLKNNQPFFQVVNLTQSHESRAFGDVNHTEHDPANTQLRKYHPDVPAMRKNYAHYHDAMKKMDTAVGETLARLEELGLAENTIVIHNSDHGGVLPRSKRYLFESGLHCPLIIRIPPKFKALWPAAAPGMQVDRLISFIDMPKTWLSITGAKVPETMQGRIFLGPQTEPEQKLHFAFRGRMDERVENARAVCNKQFLYIRNYMPYVPWMQHLNYLWKMQATQAWEKHIESGQASEVQARFFKPKGWTEELYDMRNDPDSIDNLIDNPEYAQVIAQMRTALRGWQLQIHDAGLLPESEMAKRAEENNTTIYEMVRNPKLYNLPALLKAADIALTKSSMTFPMLADMIKDSDPGIRYWGAIGCFQVKAKPAGIHALLEDESHEVRAMVAWLMVRTGEQEKGIHCLEALLKEESYATLTVLNIIDWMGDEGKILMPTVRSLRVKNYEARMQLYLLEKFSMESKRNS